MSTRAAPGFGPRALALCAGGGYLVAVAVTATTWGFWTVERNMRAMDRFGEQVADDLAYLAVEPMMRPDRIGLGLLAKRMAERAEIRSIEMYNVDGAPLVVEGNPRSDGAAYVRRVAIQDTVAGHVRVTLHADEFRLRAYELLAQSWVVLATGLLVVAGVAYAFGRLPTRTRATPTPTAAVADTEPEMPDQVFMLLATLFPRSDVDTLASADVLRRSMAIAERVANLYAGEARYWRDAGLALVFQATTSEDRAFEVVCAALLIQRLLGDSGDDNAPPDDVTPADSQTQGGASPSPFRLGLDLVTGDWLDDKAAAVDGPSAEAVAVLASLAPNGRLVVGRAAYAAIGNTERIRLRTFENPAFRALSGDAVPQGIITGTDASYEALIAKQADLVVAATSPA